MNKCTPILLGLATSAVLHAQNPEASPPGGPPAPPGPMRFELSPPMKAELDRWQRTATNWAAHPAVVRAVAAANKAGPLKGMSNKEWDKLEDSDPRVLGLRITREAIDLRKHVQGSKGALRGLILNGDRGHKVAFTQKPLRYLDAGQPVVDKPLQTGKAVQVEPEVNGSKRIYRVQVAVPVYGAPKVGRSPADTKKTRPVIGTLVVDVHLSHLAKVAAIAAQRDRKVKNQSTPAGSPR